MSPTDVGTSNLIDPEFKQDSNSVVSDVEDNQLIVVPGRRNYSLDHDPVDPEIVDQVSVGPSNERDISLDLNDHSIVSPDIYDQVVNQNSIIDQAEGDLLPSGRPRRKVTLRGRPLDDEFHYY